MEAHIQAINALVGKMLDSGKPDPRVLAVAAECYQLYMDYLDELETTIKVEPHDIVVRVNGETIKFRDIGDAASWITTLL